MGTTNDDWSASLPRYFTIPLGLLQDEALNHHAVFIVALVHFRQCGDHGVSYDTNESIRRLLRLSKQRVSELVQDLIEQGYLVAEYHELSRKRRRENHSGYRTGRTLGLGPRAVEAMNRYRAAEDRSPPAVVSRIVR